MPVLPKNGRSFRRSCYRRGAERLTADTTGAIDHAIGARGPAVLFYRLRIGLHHLSADDGPELSVLYEVSQALQGLAHDFDTACTVPEIKTILSDEDFSPMWPKTHLEIRVWKMKIYRRGRNLDIIWDVQNHKTYFLKFHNVDGISNLPPPRLHYRWQYKNEYK